MTQLNSKPIKTILQEEWAKDRDFLKEMVKTIRQQVRKGSRNGYKPRSFHTRVGNLLLPKIREFSFQTQLLDNYPRSEKA